VGRVEKRKDMHSAVQKVSDPSYYIFIHSKLIFKKLGVKFQVIYIFYTATQLHSYTATQLHSYRPIRVNN
jgi:hypothetical protein